MTWEKVITKSDLCLYYDNIDPSTLRKWIKRLIEKGKVKFTYDDWKSYRVLPRKMKEEIKNNL